MDIVSTDRGPSGGDPAAANLAGASFCNEGAPVGRGVLEPTGDCRIPSVKSEDSMADARDRWNTADQLRSRAGHLRRLAASSSIPAIAVSLLHLAEMLEDSARKFEDASPGLGRPQSINIHAEASPAPRPTW